MWITCGGDGRDHAVTAEDIAAGAYGWLEEALNLPITSALADLLTSGDRLC